MELTPVQVRVLGCLVEKAATTPEQYPLSTNALRLACNQKTNRYPVVDYRDVDVDQAMLALREDKLARTVSGQGMRASKHRHVLDEAWGLDPRELALLGVLMVRGAQTAGELRTRTDRIAHFESPAEVEAVLERLAARSPEPLVVRLTRQPGQKEERWAHLLLGDAEQVPSAPADGGGAAGGAPRTADGGLARRVEELEATVAELRRRVDTLYDALGEPDA